MSGGVGGGVSASAGVSQRRKQRAAAARLLLSLHAEGQLDNPASWTWELLNRLPAWCLLSSDERRRLQLTCGALFLSAELRLWIRRDALNSLRSLLGEAVFDGVVTEADRLALPREPAMRMLEEAGVNDLQVDPATISQALMGAGAAVLSATVHESLPRELLLQSLGPTVGSLDEATANALLERADRILAIAEAVPPRAAESSA